MSLTFHHLAIVCSDLARCERFYREVLGLAVMRRWPREDGEGDRSVWMQVGDGFLALERAEATSAPRGATQPVEPWRGGKPGLHLIALRIEPGEREGWEVRLKESGVDVAHRTRWTIYVRDPEGNRVGLTHYPSDAAASPSPVAGQSPAPPSEQL